MRGTVSLHDLYNRYEGRIQFLMVYIREAHPVDGWWLGRQPFRFFVQRFAPKTALDITDPQTLEERRQVAGQCSTTLAYGVRTVVDTLDDAANRAYAAWPTRQYLIGPDGRVRYAGGLGPYGFKPAELETAINTLLAEAPAHSS